MAAEFESLEANLRQSFRALALGRPRAEIAELEGVSVASLGVSFQMFNAAFLSGPVATRDALEVRLDTARRFFAARGLAWSFWICEGWLDRQARRALVRTCEAAGMRAVAEMPGMVTDSLREEGRSLRGTSSAPLEIRRVDTPAGLRDFRGIGSVCFHVPPHWFAEVFDDNMPLRDFACWVGYRNDRPVATAATVVTDGVIGLYNVATLPDERGRGYGEAITRRAIAEAGRVAGDPGRAILQSTALGERLYKRLGFREVSRVVVFNSL